MKNECDVVPISETWCNDDRITVNLLYQIPNYIPFHQIRTLGDKGRGLAMYIQKTITFKTTEKLSNNNEHIERLSVEIIRKIRRISFYCSFTDLQEAIRIYLPVK